MADFNLAEAITGFASSTESNWNNFNKPIPNNVVIVTADTKKFKRGDGIHLFADLPEGPSIEGISSGESSISNVLVQLGALDEDDIIVIDNEIYSPSGTKLTTTLNRVAAIGNTDSIQDANLDAIDSQFQLTDKTLTSADNGKLAIIINNKITPGSLPNDIVVMEPPSPIHIINYGLYSDKSCTIPVTSIYFDSVYYWLTEASHDTADLDNLTYELTSTLGANVTITQIKRGLFKIAVIHPQNISTASFTGTVSYNTNTTSEVLDVTVNSYTPMILGVYAGTAVDIFHKVVFDSNSNVIAVGSTLSEGPVASTKAQLVVKFDSNMDVICRKVCGISGAADFNNVTIDSSDNIICVGYNAIGSNYYPTIMKFDSDLTLIGCHQFTYQYSSNAFYAVEIDSNGRIICVGSAFNTVTRAFIAIFNTDLELINSKYYGNNATTFYGVAVDSQDNIICVGATTEYNYAVIVRFDASLNILYKKLFSGTGSTSFNAVAVDSQDKIICAGYGNPNTGNNRCIIVKFNLSLEIVISKYYDGNYNDIFRDMVVDGNDNVICSGYSTSSLVTSSTVNEGIVIKFDTNLNILSSKFVTGLSNNQFDGVAVYNNKIACVGYTESYSSGGLNGLIAIFPSDIPSGTFASNLGTISMKDVELTLSTNTFNTSATTTLDVTVSSPTSAYPTVTVSDSALTFDKDTIDY